MRLSWWIKMFRTWPWTNLFQHWRRYSLFKLRYHKPLSMLNVNFALDLIDSFYWMTYFNHQSFKIISNLDANEQRIISKSTLCQKTGRSWSVFWPADLIRKDSFARRLATKWSVWSDLTLIWSNWTDNVRTGILERECNHDVCQSVRFRTGYRLWFIDYQL